MPAARTRDSALERRVQGGVASAVRYVRVHLATEAHKGCDTARLYGALAVEGVVAVRVGGERNGGKVEYKERGAMRRAESEIVIKF